MYVYRLASEHTPVMCTQFALRFVAASAYAHCAVFLIFFPILDALATSPEPPFELAHWEPLEQLRFGRQLLKSHFLLDAEWTFVNHGAFGATLSELELECQRWRLYLEV
jgi:hypothetical protein